MALSAAVILEVRTTGSDTNGGGFKAGASGTDWSQQDAAQYSVTDGVTAGTTTITSATANFGTDVVGNLIYVQGGTGSVVAGWYEITARTNSTTITVDRSTGLTAGTGVTLKIGGALASPGQAGAILVAGNICWVKAGTFPITSTSSNVSGGRVTIPTSGLTTHTRLVGYQTTRGDLTGTRPLIQASGIASVVLITGSAGTWLDNFEIDGASLTGIDGTNSFALVSNLKVHHCAIGISSSTGSAVLCESYSCTTAGNYATNKSFCVSYSNSGHGFQGNASGVAIRCASWSNTFSGFINTLLYVECTSHGNGHSGFGTNTSVRTTAINCVSTGNTQYGFDSGSTTADLMNLVSCASRSNTSGRFRGLSSVDISSVTLSGDPYANVAGLGSATTLQAMLQCLSPNNTAGAGALLRAAGIVPYSDIGAVQHQDSGGSGATPRFGLAGAGPSFRGVGV